MLMKNSTFRNCFERDFTKEVLEDLRYRLFGRIPRNWLINISGLVGVPTGIFKSSMGLQICLSLNPMFNLREHVAFSVNELLDKIKNNSEYSLCNRCYIQFFKSYYGTYETQEVDTAKKCDNCDSISDKNVLLTKIIYFLDEQTKTLRIGGLTRLANIVDTARQRQICFVTCGVESYDMSFCTYHLQRIQESHDDYLPKKLVRYAVYDDQRDLFYGYFKWNITPLSDPRWKRVWDDYSKMKTNFQRVAMSGQIQQMNFEEYAQQVMSDKDFDKCFKETKDGRQIFQSSLAKNLIFKYFPDLTVSERDFILSEMKMMLQDED